MPRALYVTPEMHVKSRGAEKMVHANPGSALHIKAKMTKFAEKKRKLRQI